ncbi:MAG: hypothetical protein NT040_12045 [Bacteroidetes bacterium]|nr:hypothetical protein [Bacteroidota bacterium]
MTAQEMDALVQGVFDNIFNSATKAEPGGKPLFPASSTMLTLMKPGMAINPVDYRLPWTPGNNSGSKDAAINTARLVDAIPKANSLYQDSGNTISQVYSDILSSVSIPKQPANPALDAQIEAAHSVLYRIIDVTDSDTGVVTKSTVETQLYRDYKDNEVAYQNARLAYLQSYLAAQETPQGRNTWPLVAPTMQIPVKQAWDKWRSNKADLIEQNLAIMTTSAQNTLQKAFKKAQDLFEGYGATLEETGGLSPKIHRVSLIPSNWYSSNDNSGWAHIKVAAGTSSTSSSSDYKSFGASAGFSLGIWSIGAKAGGSKESRNFSSETKNLSFEFYYKLVGIRRPWMSFHLLGTKTWNLGNFSPKKGGISNGSKNQPKAMWPLMPTSFVVVKGIKITASWAKTDWDMMKSTLSTGGSVGIGPFTIGGSYAQSHSDEHWTSSFANGEIVVPGVQIIGWINTIVPYSAPVDMPK